MATQDDMQKLIRKTSITNPFIWYNVVNYDKIEQAIADIAILMGKPITAIYDDLMYEATTSPLPILTFLHQKIWELQFESVSIEVSTQPAYQALIESLHPWHVRFYHSIQRLFS